MVDYRALLRKEYVARINRVADYIRAHLNGDLCLDTLARVANFSPYHFHRIFRGMTGETLNTFIRRIRAEAAAMKLINNPKMTITSIAMHCGFSSSAAFAREFKTFSGMSASQFRNGGQQSLRKIREVGSKIDQSVRKNGKDTVLASSYTEGVIQTLRRRRASMIEMNVEVKELPELQVAYIRHIGPYHGIPEAFKKLDRWAGPRGLINFPETKFLGVYHDNPEITEESKLRSSACITVPEDTPIEGEVGKMTIPGGLFAVAHVEINEDQYAEAWDKLMGEWFPESGYQPDDRMCYELYLNDPKQHPQGKHIVDICEPVRPL
jgi:AraC family transcriptional regulator